MTGNSKRPVTQTMGSGDRAVMMVEVMSGGKCCVKKCVLTSFLNTAGLAAARMSGGSEFHAAGPACKKACSPNLVHSRGVTYLYLLVEADRRPVRVAALLDVRIIF